MTKKELLAFVSFKGTVSSVLSELVWYADDYNSSEIKGIATKLKRAIDTVNKEIK